MNAKLSELVCADGVDYIRIDHLPKSGYSLHVMLYGKWYAFSGHKLSKVVKSAWKFVTTF